MLCVTGDTYDIRDELKRLGCRWSDGAWVAPDESARSAAQALADAEPWRKWRAFMDTQAWCTGSFTQTAFEAGMNACTRGIPLDAAMSEIRDRIAAAGKMPEPGWIERNVGRAYSYAGAANVAAGGRFTEAPLQRVKPVFAEDKLAAFAGSWAKVVCREWLRERSMVDPQSCDAEAFLGHLYEQGEHVVVLDVFASQGQWLWSKDAGFESSVVDYRRWEGEDKLHENAPPVCKAAPFTSKGPDGIWFLNTPVSGSFFKTAELDKWDRPKWSRRSESGVTSWRYFVLESDEADPRAWVGAMVQLPLAIAAIYTSGGRSVHVLVRVDAESKAEFDEWRETAKRSMIPLGADPCCMSAVRLTRLPCCLRGSKVQRLLYLNPSPAERRLIDL